MCRLVGILVVTLVAVFPSAAGATWPGKTGTVGYFALDVDDEGARDGVYTIGADGSGNQRIVRRAVRDIAWSRDGQRIAFFRTGRELWEARSDGSEARRIVRLGRGAGSEPAWSPMGRRLVFTRTIRRRGVKVDEVWLVDRDGSGARRLLRGHAATWSSRGAIGYATADGDVATIRPGGRGNRIWVPQGSPVVVVELDFSPDGRRLVYQQIDARLRRSTIRTFDLRTGRRTSFRDLTRNVLASDVIWVPGGRRLAYAHRPPGNGPDQLRTIRPNGSDRKTIFAFPSGLTPFDIAWQTR